MLTSPKLMVPVQTACLMPRLFHQPPRRSSLALRAQPPRGHKYRQRVDGHPVVPPPRAGAVPIDVVGVGAQPFRHAPLVPLLRGPAPIRQSLFLEQIEGIGAAPVADLADLRHRPKAAEDV